jgi:hypothetical protein
VGSCQLRDQIGFLHKVNPGALSSKIALHESAPWASLFSPPVDWSRRFFDSVLALRNCVEPIRKLRKAADTQYLFQGSGAC